MLRAVAKHSLPLAQAVPLVKAQALQAVVDSGAMESLVGCLEASLFGAHERRRQEFDPSVKESAAWALGYIAPRAWHDASLKSEAKHSKELAQSVVDAGAVPLLVLAFQALKEARQVVHEEPEPTLKRISASALSDVAKHSPELAHVVVDAGACALLVKAGLPHGKRMGFRRSLAAMRH